MDRTKIIGIAIAVIFSFLALSLFNLEIIRARKFRELSNRNCVRLLPQEGCRGKILDRSGQPIATSEISYDFTVFARTSGSAAELFSRAAKILGVSANSLQDKFKNGIVAQFAPVTVAKNISSRQAIALEELKSDYPQILIQPHPNRAYPFGRLCAHVLGYLNEIDRSRLTRLEDYGYQTKDIVGFGGVEELYDYYLRQEEGGVSVEVDHRGRLVRTLGYRPPKDGKDILLTIDIKIQKIVEEALSGHTGCALVMDPNTGEILAMASFPTFSLYSFVRKDNSVIQGLFRSPQAPLINRAISAAFPPGSIFKVVVATAALESGKLHASRTFFCPGSFRVGRQEFACWNTHHSQNLVNAIAHSCNVFFYHTGLLIGAQLIHDYALRFGFARISGIDLPYEKQGFIPSPLWRRVSRLRNWFDGDTANFAIGQGEALVTPLQIARMMAVFANQGKLVRPYLVRAIAGRDIFSEQQKVSIFPIKESTMQHIREGMRGVANFPDGTASIMAELPVAVAGKTGTAQAPPGAPHGWFAGFFPFKNPKFVICVFLERGSAGYYASMVAKEIIEKMAQENLI
jgi:penicillin-binding protein 2